MRERSWQEFTAEMKATHTILIPNMASIHFEIFKNIFLYHGYKVELLTTTDQRIVEEGLRYVHNDTCYPALLCIGQIMDALHSGKYDLSKTALILSQTGGGCRASNYIHLLRKALKTDGLGHIPVISFSASGLEKHSGFQLSLAMVHHLLVGLVYGDLLMLLSNQTRPYEVAAGETDRLVENWTRRLAKLMAQKKVFSRVGIKRYLNEIADDFAAISLEKRDKTKVGIVGEIYVKYSPLANNHLEKFLAEHDCEVNVPGILGFVLYCAKNNVIDIKLYGGHLLNRIVHQLIFRYVEGYEKLLIQAVGRHSKFLAPWPHQRLFQEGTKVVGEGCKMGEGWLLTAEMVELIHHGFSNIVCTQPFGCLPNHIVGKGMIRNLRESFNANIVAIDYDPGATHVNQENRLKLMLAVAKEGKLKERAASLAEMAD